MRRRLPCFIATQDDLIASGLQPDRHGLKQALWESASGVYFADGKVRRKKSQALAFTIPGSNPIRGIGQLRMSTGVRWLWAGAGGKIYRWAFGAPEEISAAYGTYQADETSIALPTFYDFTPYGDWMIVNDGIAPYIYKPSPGPGWTAWAGEVPQAAVLYMKVMNFMLAIGYGTRKTRVGWSDADDIDTWTAAADNLAGSLTIDEFDTPIVTAARLGEAIAVYAYDQMCFVRYVGGSNVFGFKPGLDGIGAIGKMAVASDTRINVGMSRDGAWWTDGNTFKFIDDGLVHDYFQDNINWAQASKTVVSRNDVTGCFEFRIPVGVSDVFENWSWDPKNGGWTKITEVGTILVERRLFNYPILGRANGQVCLGDYNYNLVIPLDLTTKPLMLLHEDGTNRGTHIVTHVDELELWLKEAAFVEVRVGSSDDPVGTWEWGNWEDVETGSRIIELSRVPENSLWKVQFRNKAGHDTDWRLNLQGFLLYGSGPSGTKKER